MSNVDIVLWTEYRKVAEQGDGDLGYREWLEAQVRSSSQSDTRWQRLRERVMAEIEALRTALRNGMAFQSEAKKFIIANETILEWMSELESDAADGK